MLSHDITAKVGSHKNRKRVGRGRGAGNGKTCGRGHKGQKSRAGYSRRALYQGGAMPLFQRIPKVGFNNFNYAKTFEIVNIIELEKLFDDGAVIDIQKLADCGLVDSDQSKVKVLGEGQLTKKFSVSAHKFSKSAEQKIADCGGSVQVVA